MTSSVAAKFSTLNYLDMCIQLLWLDRLAYLLGDFHLSSFGKRDMSASDS